MFRIALVLLVISFHSASAAGRRPTGKLIATGWDSPTPARWKKELPAFERLGAFQGTTIVPTRRTDRGDIAAHNAFSADHWTWAEFASAVADLKAAKSATVTENFLMIYANPGGVDWFDDDGWKEVIDHCRLLARLAKEAGLRGLLFDTEPYTPPFSQFNYSAQPGRAKHTFPEYAAKARERGREFMKVIAEEFPGCVILTYRLLCDLLPIATADGDATAQLAASTFGLTPAFVDGWLDMVPPDVRIVEGDENAYRFNSREEFDRAYTELRVAAPRLLAAEHQTKYRTQVDIGHGIYVDAHVNPPGDAWHIDRKGTTSAARLEANVSEALRASDGWVWIYSNAGRWWTGGNLKYPAWDDQLPGASTALARAARPLQAAVANLEKKGSTNLLTNGTFAETNDKHQPKHWWTWQQKNSKGQFGLAGAGGVAEIRRTVKGCFGQTIPVQFGKTYAISVIVRSNGSGVASAGVRWKSSAEKWVDGDDTSLTPVGPADADGWRRHVALVRVPALAARLVFVLSADQQLENGVAEFMDARLVECGSER